MLEEVNSMLEGGPLAEELASLRAALAHYQHAAHIGALQLQRHSLDASSTFERSKQLELENARLREEVQVLRLDPDTTPHPSEISVAELTVAHRRLSDRLSIVEATLLERNTELNHATRRIETLLTQLDVNKELLERARQLQDDERRNVLTLQGRLKTAEEQRNMAERTVADYAELVKQMEGRATKTNKETDAASGKSVRRDSATAFDHFDAGRAGLQRLLEEFNETTTSLQQEISRLHHELEDREQALDIERTLGEEDRTKLALAMTEMDQYKANDRSAANMVSRYMKFSQNSIDLLQTALDTQRKRHSSTLATLDAEHGSLQKELLSTRADTKRMRDVLDELTEDISRESFGRRREVALRLRLSRREEETADALKTLNRRLQEGLNRLNTDEKVAATEGTIKLLERALKDTGSMLERLDGSATTSSISDSSSPSKLRDEHWSEGSITRVIVSQEAVATLVDELHVETEKRLDLEKRLADALLSSKDMGIPSSSKGTINSGTVSRETLVDAMFSPPQPSSATTTVSSLSAEPVTPLAPKDESGLSIHSTPIASPTIIPDETPQPDQLPHQTIPAEPLLLAVQKPMDAISPLILAEGDINFDQLHIHVPTLQDPSQPDSKVLELSSSLAVASHRYDSIARSFKNCHTTLSKLKTDLHSLTSMPAEAPDMKLLNTFLGRLEDYCEDCSVELEIRVADEERLVKGWETMLTIPGALGEESMRESMEHQVKNFVSGVDPAVTRALKTFNRKLEDLEHDVVLLKRAVHEVGFRSADDEENTVKLDTPPNGTSDGSSGNSSAIPWSWTSDLLAPIRSRPSSPIPPPTFGSITQQQTPSSSPSASSPLRSYSGSVPSQRAEPAPAPEEVMNTLPQNLADLPFRISMPRTTMRPTQHYQQSTNASLFSSLASRAHASSSPMYGAPPPVSGSFSSPGFGNSHHRHQLLKSPSGFGLGLRRPSMSASPSNLTLTAPRPLSRSSSSVELSGINKSTGSENGNGNHSSDVRQSGMESTKQNVDHDEMTDEINSDVE